MIIVEFYRSSSLGAVGGRFRFRIKGANGEKLALGEGYRDRRDAEHAVRLIFGVDEGGKMPAHVRVKVEAGWNR